MPCPTCRQSTLRSFTFSTGETIELCPCGYESGHEVLRQGSVQQLINLEPDVNPLWQDMLVRQKLGECVGESNRWLELSPTYRDTDVPFDYSLTFKPARQPRNAATSERVLAARASAKARVRKYKAHTIQLFRSFGWQVNRSKARYVGITPKQTGPLVERQESQ